MRISETKVAQLIERDEGDTVVIVDETTGKEMELDMTEVTFLKVAFAYFKV